MDILPLPSAASTQDVSACNLVRRQQTTIPHYSNATFLLSRGKSEDKEAPLYCMTIPVLVETEWPKLPIILQMFRRTLASVDGTDPERSRFSRAHDNHRSSSAFA